MVKHMKRILVLVLVFMMTLTPITASATVTDAVGNPKQLSVTAINSSTELNNFYKATGDIVTLDAGQTEEMMPVTVEKKGALFVLAYANEGATAYPYMALYKDEAGTQTVSNYYSENTADGTGTLKEYAVSAGTYYIKLSRIDSAAAAKYEVLVGNVNGGAKTLSQNKDTLGFSKDGSKNVYYKVTVTKPGSLEVTTAFDSSYGSAYITLCNSSKKALSKKSSVYSGGGSNYFAVKKGTYYIRVATSSGLFQIKRKTTNVNDVSGSTKAKAKALKKGGTSVKAKGLMLISDATSKADWYKVTLTKKQTIAFGFAGDCTGTLSMEIIPASGRLYGTNKVNITESRNSTGVQSSGAWSKGTYYIKVTKATKAASGYYELYVK